MITTLDAVRADIADRLSDAATNRNAPMHCPAVVTGDVDARTMVLRGFDPSDWTMRFHTDARAPKVAVIERDPRVAVLCYDKPAKVQIRLRGTGHILRDDPIVDAAWAQGTNFARRCYLGEGPGAASVEPTSGLPAAFEGREPGDDELVEARAHFAVLAVAIEVMDWFTLAHTGHRRARFERTGESWRGEWVSP